MSFPADCWMAHSSSGVSASEAPAPRDVPINSRREIMRSLLLWNSPLSSRATVTPECWESLAAGWQFCWRALDRLIPRNSVPNLTSDYSTAMRILRFLGKAILVLVLLALVVWFAGEQITRWQTN